MLVKRPIYNQQLKCVAFEILSYQKLKLNAELTNRLFELINNSDTHLPLFIPFSLRSLVEQFKAPVKNPIILKLPAEEIESIYSLSELRESLFSIALLVNTPQQLAWMNFAEYIGLTEQLMNETDVSKIVKLSKSKQRKVIAYGIDQPDCFDKCKAMTMDYYCGNFLFKPADDNQTDIAANKLNVLHLIQTLQHDDCDFKAISTIIETDPLLSFQLLKIANSVGFSGYQSIESINQAVARLGMINLKNWVMVLSMKNISDKPVEILESGLIRAHMAQELAKSCSDISSQSAYTAGLLSILDSLLNKPITELINQITIAEEIKKALMERSGSLGQLLGVVIAYEEGHWEDLTQDIINEMDLSKLYIDCLAFIAKSAKVMRH